MFGLSRDDEGLLHDTVAWGMLWLSVPTFLLLYFIAPSLWGKTLSATSTSASNMKTSGGINSAQQLLLPTGIFVDARVGWVAFESPNLIWSAVCYAHRDEAVFGPTNALLLTLFVAHYVNRGIVYPLFATGRRRRKLPVEVVLSAAAYTACNGYLQAQNLCRFQFFPNRQHFAEPSFLAGLAMFVIGVAINIHSDLILTGLKEKGSVKDDENDNDNDSQGSDLYRIPHGGMFRYVSAPHYLGEIVEWAGFAVMASNSVAAWSFAVFTAANLVPRAVAHHDWYNRRFPDAYPQLRRKAIVPFLW